MSPKYNNPYKDEKSERPTEFKAPETGWQLGYMLLTSRNGRMLFNASYRSILGLFVGLTWNDGRKTWDSIQTIPAMTQRIERIEKALTAKGILSAQVRLDDTALQAIPE
jgi:hypothetical protein